MHRQLMEIIIESNTSITNTHLFTQLIPIYFINVEKTNNKTDTSIVRITYLFNFRNVFILFESNIFLFIKIKSLEF